MGFQRHHRQRSGVDEPRRITSDIIIVAPGFAPPSRATFHALPWPHFPWASRPIFRLGWRMSPISPRAVAFLAVMTTVAALGAIEPTDPDPQSLPAQASLPEALMSVDGQRVTT